VTAMDKLLQTRIINHNGLAIKSGPVIYWMNRDQRVDDNWAVLFADQLVRNNHGRLIVFFNVMPHFLKLEYDPSNRIYEFMFSGLTIVRERCRALGISLTIAYGDAEKNLLSLIKTNDVGAVVGDYTPLREMRHLKKRIAAALDIAYYEIDAHNVVPITIASPKLEWGAYTLRPKIAKLLPDYLIPVPKLTFRDGYKETIDKTILPLLTKRPTYVDPLKAMEDFIANRLADYHFRSNPNFDATSRLSKYLHFGQLAASRLAIEVRSSGHPSDEFIEESIVRRELADNYCHYNEHYDSFDGFPAWAKATLNAHRNDPRPYVYSLTQFEKGFTEDHVWNAAQKEMVKTGYMHGYMRMYWAKKILEWTRSPEEAVEIAIYLNDKYQLDGRDPNGYTGIAWAIGGVHDRPWAERPIFGMIRYMNMSGLKRKFGIDAYIEKWNDDVVSLL